MVVTGKYKRNWKNKKSRIAKRLSAAVYLLLFSCLLESGCSIQQGKYSEETKQIAIKDAMDRKKEEQKTGVTICAGNRTGSGVIWKIEEDKVTILTAGHVLGEAVDDLKERTAKADITVVFPNGDKATARVEKKFEDRDLAILTVDKALLGAELEETCAVQNGGYADKQRSDSLNTGDMLTIIASVSEPGGEEENCILLNNWIYIEDFDQYMMLAALPEETDKGALPGMSGAGIFDEEGYFAGILCGVDDTGTLAVLPYSLIECADEL